MLSLLQLSCELEDFLVLLFFALIASGQLALIILDTGADCTTIVLGSLDIMIDPLYLVLSLIEHVLRIHNVAVQFIGLLAHLCILLFEVL